MLWNLENSSDALKFLLDDFSSRDIFVLFSIILLDCTLKFIPPRVVYVAYWSAPDMKSIAGSDGLTDCFLFVKAFRDVFGIFS